MGAVDPARDYPPCPSCKMELGTPIAHETMIERWDGPANATLFCPACGTGWVGSPEHLAQAWASWRAYEAEMAAHGTQEGR